MYEFTNLVLFLMVARYLNQSSDVKYLISVLVKSNSGNLLRQCGTRAVRENQQERRLSQ